MDDSHSDPVQIPLPTSPPADESAAQGLGDFHLSSGTQPQPDPISASSTQPREDEHVDESQNPSFAQNQHENRDSQPSSTHDTDSVLALAPQPPEKPITDVVATVEHADSSVTSESLQEATAVPSPQTTNAPEIISPSPSSIRQPPNIPHPNPTSPPPTHSPSSSGHKRSLTLSRGNTVSVVLIASALETIAASKDAKRSAPLRESTQQALELIRNNEGGDRPREIFEPLRLACETRNEKLMIASLDCISKLISYSFFAEAPSASIVQYSSPPPSPGPSGRNSSASDHPPSLVDLVVHTITACHSETTPETVSLQIVKALLSLVLSPTILVHHSSLLKAVRTVYNVFLLSTDPVNQMVAQGGLTQMVHHVFTRCGMSPAAKSANGTDLPHSPSQDSLASKQMSSFTLSSPPPPRPRSVASSAVNGHNAEDGDMEAEASMSTTSVNLRSEPLSPSVQPETPTNGSSHQRQGSQG